MVWSRRLLDRSLNHLERSDLNINHPTLNPSLPKPLINFPPPTPVDSIANIKQTDSSSADTQQVSATSAHPTADSKPDDYPAACSSHPPEILPTLCGTSSASFKRQPSPSMYDSGINIPRQTEDLPDWLNGCITGAPQTSNYIHANVSLHSTAAINPTPSMTETLGFVPGTPGTRFTKDQPRFAVSVTKQLKKHRSAAPVSTTTAQLDCPVVQPATLPAASKGKSNSARSAKPKQTHVSSGDKSASSVLNPSAKRQAKAVEQPPLLGQLEQPELARKFI
ncbi:hypothetical protein PGT21_001777 [Puccinia graminis f. sp. tritici]|uniref:Uncharacterized protein n=1 Tax=Puccinia graminis f. sp. tritici TaxID=56615 RepID=A0A5B0Q9N9_PUCGR|nr:hypothetical protein PGT21_001777 [Puccinia graminis f. sp. tritici]